MNDPENRIWKLMTSSSPVSTSSEKRSHFKHLDVYFLLEAGGDVDLGVPINES